MWRELYNLPPMGDEERPVHVKHCELACLRRGGGERGGEGEGADYGTPPARVLPQRESGKERCKERGQGEEDGPRGTVQLRGGVWGTLNLILASTASQAGSLALTPLLFWHAASSGRSVGGESSSISWSLMWVIARERTPSRLGETDGVTSPELHTSTGERIVCKVKKNSRNL